MSLIVSLMNNFRADAEEFDRFEFRLTEGGAYNAYLEQGSRASSFLTPDLIAKARASRGVDVEIPVIDYEDVTIRTTRPVTIVDSENTSALYTVTWATLAFGFKMYPAQHGTNDVSFQKDFNRKMAKMLVKMRATLDTQAVAALDAGTTQVINQLVGGHTFASDLLTETLAANSNTRDSYIISDISPIMSGNDYEDFGIDIVGNQGIHSIMRRLDGFGAANQENKTLAFGGKTFQFSNNIADGVTASVTTHGTGFGIADGTLALLTRVEADSLLGTSLGSSHNWGTTVLPGLGIEVGTYEYDEAVDASTPTGQATLTRAGAHVMDFAVDVAFVNAYNSDLATIPSGIVKFEVNITD